MKVGDLVRMKPHGSIALVLKMPRNVGRRSLVRVWIKSQKEDWAVRDCEVVSESR